MKRLICNIRPVTLGIALTISALAWPLSASAATAPVMGISSFEQLSQPLPKPYDEKADANRDVAAARLRARKAGKLLLVDLGGNWCADCRILAGTMETEPLRTWVARRYELVTVDIGRFDKNLQIQQHYGIKGRLEGVPALLVVDPRTDKLLNPGRTSALADARSMTPQALADWLALWPRK